MPLSKIQDVENQVVPNLGRRNILINGKFNIDQRHNFTSHTITAGSDFFADRWGFYSNSAAVAQYGATSQVVDDGPDGFDKSMKWTTTSVTGAGIPATSEVIYRQPIEGYNIAHVNYGSANAKDLILSFYVKASIAGNYGLQCQFEDTTSTQNYIQRSYTVSATNTWERVTVTIPANTTKVMKEKTTGAGLRVNWDFGEGATYSTAVSNTWGTSYTNGLQGGVKLAENNGATWQITGAQLEIGDTASDFEHLTFAEDLALCQRYFQAVVPKGVNIGYVTPAWNYSSSIMVGILDHKVEMRAAPTLETNDGTNDFRFYRAGAADDFDDLLLSAPSSTKCTAVYNSTDISGTQGHAGGIYINDTTNAFVHLKAEL